MTSRWLRNRFHFTRLAGHLVTLALVAQGAQAEPRTQAAPTASPAALPLSESLSGEAKDEYEAGKLLFTNGDHESAALKFQHAYELAKDPRLLWNIAAAEKHLRHYARVEALLTEFLSASGTGLAESDRTSALDLLDTVKAFIVEVTLDVNEPQAKVLVDEAEVGQTPLAAPLRLDMGTRKLSVTKPGFESFAVVRTFAGGAKEAIAVTLVAEAHEGRLHVSAGPGTSISIDGKPVGVGDWEGKLASGSHRVELTADGKRTWRSDSVVRDGQLTSVMVSLEDASKGAAGPIPKWVWIVGGGVAAAGLGVGAYFLFKPEDKGPPAPTPGTFTTVELPFFMR